MAVKKAKPKNMTTALLVVLGVVVIGLLNWFFFLKPGLAEVGALREARDQLEQDIDALNQKLAEKPQIEQRWKEISEQEAELRARIPAAGDLPKVLGALEKLVGSSKAKIKTFNAGEYQSLEGYRYVPIDLWVEGASDELLQLLEDLEQFTHMTLTERAGIEKSEEAYRMSVNFNLIFNPEGRADKVGSDGDQNQDEGGEPEQDQDLDQG